MLHIDLFSGIGGFALAVDTVWSNAEHIFCDNDNFCQQVLKKHWPNSKIYGDIRTLTNTIGTGLDAEHTSEAQTIQSTEWTYEKENTIGERRFEPSTNNEYFILTGGFPCQPFSQAGQRKGTADNRYLWPEMLRVIQLTKPQWVIAENVRGLLTWNEGMVFKQVCSDLENEGYEVQPFVIPAVAVNAPHRRDRIWFVAHCGHSDAQRYKSIPTISWKKSGVEFISQDWQKNWIEVATELCGVDDGLPAKLDGFELSKSAHRRERLKSLGNAIVPQVAIEIMKGIKSQDFSG